MLLPPGPGPHPAVLLLHDHGSDFAIGKEKVVTPWDDPARAAEAAAWQARLYDGVSLGEALLARGFAVLAADALGWGSRQGNGYDAQQALAANLMQFGLTLAGVIAAEDAQLARWLARHPAVDARRVGVLGFSFGGYRAWQAAALCPEVAAGVAAGWMGRLGDLMRPGGNQLRGQSAFAMLHPALGRAPRLSRRRRASRRRSRCCSCRGVRTGTSRRRWPKGRSATCGGSGRPPARARRSAPRSPTVPTSSRWRSRRAPPRFSSGRWRRRR